MIQEFSFGLALLALSAQVVIPVPPLAPAHMLFPADVDWGRFIGDVMATWADDGRTMVLTEPFGYIDPTGSTWDAPSGSIIDGATIPRFAWTIVGGPFEGPYRRASVIHDVACDEKAQPWASVHRAFYTAMRAAGAGRLQAKLMYAAVYHFGPRWPIVRRVERCVNVGGKRICNKVTEITEPAVATLSSETEFDFLAARIRDRESFPDEFEDAPGWMAKYGTRPLAFAMSLAEIEQFGVKR